MAAGVTGVKKLTRLPSGSRNSRDRLPQGIVVGSVTKSSTKPARFWCTPSTSSTRNSMITLRFCSTSQARTNTGQKRSGISAKFLGMTRPAARVLTLLELLQSGGVRTMTELASRLGVDGRTVRRYVGHLLDLDVPVESVRGRYGGYRLAPGYRMPPAHAER